MDLFLSTVLAIIILVGIVLCIINFGVPSIIALIIAILFGISAIGMMENDMFN